MNVTNSPQKRGADAARVLPGYQAKQAWYKIPRVEPPKREASERVCDFDEIYSLLDEATVREQASRCIQCPDPLCRIGCPLGNLIPDWLALAADGRFLEAAAVSRSTSNVPEICGRVCPQERLCEGACILNARSDPVAIGAIEKFINEYAFAHDAVEASRAVPNGLRVAIVGSGPGGMACADELAKLGYAVTIFDSQTRAGGLLVNGIPAFKLEKPIVERRLELLRDRGVKFRLGVTIGRDVSLSVVREQFDAIYLAIGAQKPKSLDIPGANLDGVFDALPFLIEKNLGDVSHGAVNVSEKRVVVVGGGDTAMDCLRTAIRSGAREAVCLYRRNLANMPGSRKEYANAVEEGAQFLFLTNPIALQDDGTGHISQVRCVRMELGEADAKGRRKPRAIPNSEFSVPADVVLVAFGFDPVPIFAAGNSDKIDINNWGSVIVDANQMTSVPGVFAGGDLVRGPSLVAHAVRDGRKAAAGIHRYLSSPSQCEEESVVANVSHSGTSLAGHRGSLATPAWTTIGRSDSSFAPLATTKNGQCFRANAEREIKRRDSVRL
ncbi:MAG TPA: NAD(P)-dependent oxidoreductase [Candidatus Udaeobacter sp.]|nr:NAD(P)-dependent oxidoreductase [Candidatus Udaeobacter sp.]